MIPPHHYIHSHNAQREEVRGGLGVTTPYFFVKGLTTNIIRTDLNILKTHAHVSLTTMRTTLWPPMFRLGSSLLPWLFDSEERRRGSGTSEALHS